MNKLVLGTCLANLACATALGVKETIPLPDGVPVSTNQHVSGMRAMARQKALSVLSRWMGGGKSITKVGRQSDVLGGPVFVECSEVRPEVLWAVQDVVRDYQDAVKDNIAISKCQQAVQAWCQNAIGDPESLVLPHGNPDDDNLGYVITTCNMGTTKSPGGHHTMTIRRGVTCQTAMGQVKDPEGADVVEECTLMSFNEMGSS